MNIANKLTMTRIFFTVALIVLLLFPFYMVNVEFPKFIIGTISVDLRYLIAAALFMIASFTDFLDGHIARKYNMVTDFGKMIDAIADKVLVNSVLIILCAQGFIHPIITVVIIIRDSIVNSIKMVAGSKGHVVAAIKSGKAKQDKVLIFFIFSFSINFFLLIKYNIIIPIIKIPRNFII